MLGVDGVIANPDSKYADHSESAISAGFINASTGSVAQHGSPCAAQPSSTEAAHNASPAEDAAHEQASADADKYAGSTDGAEMRDAIVAER